MSDQTGEPTPERGPDKGRRLGRGLGALIGGPTVPSSKSVSSEVTDRLRDVPLSQIVANPLQPRREFDENELRQLEGSLRIHGLLQPVTVRRATDGQGFQLIAGERRVRAARRLGWTSIPAVVREINDVQLLTLALIENLQREDLNPIEEAEGYRQLTSQFGFTQTQVAESVGKERSTVANFLRLLSLPAGVQELVRTGELSAGHARALLALPPFPDAAATVAAARRIIAQQLTVRDIERLGKEARESAGKSRTEGGVHPEAGVPSEVRMITDRLRRFLQTDVQIVADESARGEVRLRFYSADDLQRLVELITGKLEDGT